MTSILIELADRIRNEIESIDHIVKRSCKAWDKAKKATLDQDIYLDSVALNLHGFYSGIERLFELIARHIDHDKPSSKTWHQDLLKLVSKDVPRIRPAVISDNTAFRLDKLLRFRHLVRNIYATNIIPYKIESLIDDLPSLWTNLKKELSAFADFLDKLANANNQTED